jgi:APA family basic amino acid/polyamine antiporter
MAGQSNLGHARGLGVVDVTLLGIGAIVGGGVFASIGTAAVGTAERVGAGPSLIASAGLTALVCALTAVCYSELAALAPAAGSAYTYSQLAFGRTVSWFIGWTLTLEYAVANVAVATSWGNYLRGLCAGFGLHLPFWLSTETQTMLRTPELAAAAPRFLGAPFSINAFAAAVLLSLTLLLVRGMRESSQINNALVIVKILVLLLFVGLGCVLITPSGLARNWTPFAPNGMRGTLQGAAVIFFSYIGFDAVTTVAEEVDNPRRNIPVGILLSLGICATLYMAVAAVFCGLRPTGELALQLQGVQSQPMTVAVRLLGDDAAWASPIIAMGALIAQTTALLAFQIAQARIFFAMARDNLLPRAFCRVHPRFGTPHVATAVAGALVGGCSLFASMEDMLDLTDVGTLAIFCVTCLAIPVLRRRMADVPRRFKVPGGPYLCPALGAASCGLLMAQLPARAWLALGAWLGLGALVYAVYGARRPAPVVEMAGGGPTTGDRRAD